ncbi:MAG: CBS domain-containing protein [Deltaproteobacteria bacterium]|nr:CBS domain-containing protein [Deltaproteobacteria bacterium]
MGYEEPTPSEFEDAYESALSSDLKPSRFTEDLLEEPVERLGLMPPICVEPSAMIADVVAGMAERNQGCVLVTRNGVLVGVFTERDVVRRVFGKLAPEKTPVGEVMTKSPEAIAFFHTIAFALNKMTVGGFRHVPVVDKDNRPVGVISVKDIVAFFAEHFPSRVLNVPPDPMVLEPDRIGGAS